MKTVRIEFSKTGRAKFISHLDLMRAMTRAMRRARIPLWYTEGFNRHPYITFAAPLSLGYEGLCETMDLRLEEDIPNEELVSRLNAVMPEGIAVNDAYEARMKAGALAAARYRLSFSCPYDAVQSFLQKDTILVEKRTKKGNTKTVDIRPHMSDCVPEPQGECCTLFVTLPCGADNINPQLILTALRNSDPSNADINMTVVRLLLLGSDGTPFR